MREVDLAVAFRLKRPLHMSASFQISVEREATAGKIRAWCRIPTNSSWFQGHFPDNPIFPALGLFGLLDQAMGVGEGLQDRSLPHRLFKRVRFRQFVRPGEAIRLDIVPEDTEGLQRFRFNILKETESVSEGMVSVNPPGWGGTPRETVPWHIAEKADAPIEEIVPHRDIMRLVDVFAGLDETKRGITTTVARETWPLCDGSYVSSTVMIELVAQAMAAMAGWEDAKKGKRAGFGYIVGIKQAWLSGDPIRVGTPLTMITRKILTQDNYGVFSGEVVRDHRVCGEVVVQALRPE
jgi:predicted hotdog family 3-hydroxylacyl-ACP dehydratase